MKQSLSKIFNSLGHKTKNVFGPRNSSSHKGVTLTKFHLFSQLPAELRVNIIEFALFNISPRVVRIMPPQRGTSLYKEGLRGTPHPLTQVNREFRGEVARCLPPAFAVQNPKTYELSPGTIHFDFDRDVLVVPEILIRDEEISDFHKLDKLILSWRGFMGLPLAGAIAEQLYRLERCETIMIQYEAFTSRQMKLRERYKYTGRQCYTTSTSPCWKQDRKMVKDLERAFRHIELRKHEGRNPAILPIRHSWSRWGSNENPGRLYIFYKKTQGKNIILNYVNKDWKQFQKVQY
jgi:hypothetical protein